MTLEEYQALQGAIAQAEALVSTLRVVLDLSEPTQVQNVSCSANGANVKIVFDEAIGAPRIDHYDIYRGTASTGVFLASTSVIPYIDTSAPNAIYLYTVIAVDSNGRSGDPGTDTCTVSVVSPIPGVPGNFRASVTNASVIALTWTAPTTGAVPTAYQVDQVVTSASTYTNILSVNALLASATGLTQNTIYHYRVRSLNGAFNSGYVSTSARTSASQLTSDTAPYVDPVDGVTLAAHTTVSCSSIAQLQTLLANASANEWIALCSGNFNGNLTFNKTFAAANALVVKGSPNFGSIFTGGTITFTGARQILMGVDLSGSDVRIQLGGTNNKVLGNKCHGWGSTDTKIAVLCSWQPGTQGEFAYNECYSPGAWQATTVTGQSRICHRTAENGVEANFHTDAWIHHNYFHDMPEKPIPGNYGSGQSDALEWGQSGQQDFLIDFDSGLYFEDNLIENHLGRDAVVDFKAGGVKALRNTIRDCPGGRMDQRNGSFSTFESNWSENSGDFTIHGHQHRLIGNRANINLNSGTHTWNATAPTGTFHRACDECIVAGNIGAVVVGDGGYQPVNATNNTVEQNTTPGQVTVTADATGTINNAGTATAIHFTAATELQSTDVGPTKMTTAAAAYKAARGI